MKNLLTPVLITATLLAGATSVGVITSAVAYDHGHQYHSHYNHHNHHNEQAIYRDQNFGQTAQTLRMQLRQQGYIVMDIQAATHQDKSALKVYAKKNNQAYEMTYSYPGLKLLTSEKKPWSQLWHNQHQGQHFNSVKDSITKDANYTAVLQKAENKLTSMGYHIDEIEADDDHDQPILKADVDQGDKEYEIRLSYPSLTILSIEED